MAWTICTNRAGVWIGRPTLVFLKVASVEILSRLAIFERFLVFKSIMASAAPGVLPRRCKVLRVHSQTAAVPVSAGYGGGSRMWRYISFAFVRQFNFIIWLLWDSGQFGTASDCRRLFLFNTRPVGRLSVRTTRSRWVLWIPTSDPGSRRSTLCFRTCRRLAL